MQSLMTKLIFLFTLFLNDLTYSKRFHSPNLEGLRTQNLNECGRCKVLTNSIKHWLDKTSRGKYEGGDAAWEEAKLKSYARSEIRLVEVQEGLCSELSSKKDDCYLIAEEAEQAIEKWWFHEHSNTVDLHTWLCIDTLKYCCPLNHFGEYCTPCPINKNKVCNDHGKCDGEGTRSGNGTCICEKGYSGLNCEECATNYYMSGDSCRMCHKSCNGCSSEGASGCHQCKSGWKLESGVCTDINECESNSVCKSSEYCVNRDGSYRCKPCDSTCATCKGTGASNCTSCPPVRELWSGNCINDQQKSELYTTMIKRLGLYVGLCIIAIFIFRSNTVLASVIIIVIAIFIYLSEKSYSMNILELVYFVVQKQFIS